MSGHSKWATIKHKKGAADKARGKLFGKLIRQVEVAARQGGGDLEMNPTLRTMYQKARSASVPLDTIEKAIKRGTGDMEGVIYEQITYEGYAPNGVAILIDVLTDNRNRSGSDIRTALKKNGGSIAEPGAVAWQFERKGVIILPKKVTEDELMEVALEAGADDVRSDGDVFLIVTEAGKMVDVRDSLEKKGMKPAHSEVGMYPDNSVRLEGKDAESMFKLVQQLEDHDDVQNVYANFDIPDALMEQLEASVV